MAYGTIKWLNAANGFGFVETAGGASEVFLPSEEIAMLGADALAIGQAVSFEMALDHDGRVSAQNVKCR